MGGKAVIILCLAGLLFLAGCVQHDGTINDLACVAGTTDCQGMCVNLSSDTHNCGKCGFECLEDQGLTCDGGGCYLNILCGEDETKCGATNWTCYDLQTDSFNCGACGATCSTGPPMEECCSGTCVDLTSDPANCRECGHACSTGQACCAGVCVDAADNPCECDPACPKGLTCCNRTCVNLRTDNANCGRCGGGCNDYRYARQWCSEGMCIHSVP